MKFTFIAAVFASTAFAAFASAGEEATKYEIEWHEHWKVGQVVTVTESQTTDNQMSMGGNTLKEEHEKFEATYVVRCDELDDKGEPAKRTVFFKSWKKSKADTTDESISGLRVTVAGKVWTLPEGKQAGPLATKWLNRTYAKGGSNPFAKLVPPKMTVGETWKPDPKTAAAAFAESMDDAPFDPEKVTMEATLVSAEGAPPDATGKFEVKVHLPIAANPKGLPPGAVVGPASAADAVGTRAGPLTTSTMLGVEHIDMNLAMNIEMDQGGQKLAISTTGRIISDKKTVAGGEIPEPAKSDAPKPDAPKADAPAGGGK